MLSKVALLLSCFGAYASAQLGLPSTLPDATQGSYYSFNLTPGVGSSPYHSSLVADTTLPQGMQLVVSLYFGPQITGTPQVFGLFSFAIQVSDSSSPPIQQTVQYTLNIHQSGSHPFVFTATTLPDAKFGAPYAPQILVSGGVYPYQCAFTGSGLALAGFGFDRNCSLVANPALQMAGTYQVTITMLDSSVPAQTITQTFPISIQPGIELGTVLSTGSVSQAYTDHIYVAVGGTAPYTFSVSTGVLPPGLQLNSQTGAITGTPAAPGTYVFTIGVTDSKGVTGSQQYSIRIMGLTLTLTPSAMYLPTGRVGVAYNPISFTAQGGIAPYTFAVQGNGMPPGLSLSPQASSAEHLPAAAPSMSILK